MVRRAKSYPKVLAFLLADQRGPLAVLGRSALARCADKSMKRSVAKRAKTQEASPSLILTLRPLKATTFPSRLRLS